MGNSIEKPGQALKSQPQADPRTLLEHKGPLLPDPSHTHTHTPRRARQRSFHIPHQLTLAGRVQPSWQEVSPLKRRQGQRPQKLPGGHREPGKAIQRCLGRAATMSGPHSGRERCAESPWKTHRTADFIQELEGTGTASPLPRKITEGRYRGCCGTRRALPGKRQGCEFRPAPDNA